MRRGIVRTCLAVAAMLAPMAQFATHPPAAPASVAKVPICFVPPGLPWLERDVRVPRPIVRKLIDRTLSYEGVCASYGESARVGGGRVRAFTQTQDGVPRSIGMVMRTTALEELPYHPPTAGRWCFDANADGAVDGHMECTGGYDYPLRLSRTFRSSVDTPFQYVLLNWNPLGHLPMGAYDAPHFDVHFYLNPNADRLAIRTGPCGLLINCDDWAIGRRDVPSQFMPAGYTNLGAVEPGMGNHLIDLTSPELHGQPFTRTFIYGSYNGEISFYEPMVALNWVERLARGQVADECVALKLPRQWARSGWYPTTYCLRNRVNRHEITVTLEGFVYRDAP